MRTRKRPSALVIIALLALLVAACGDGGDDAGDTTTTTAGSTETTSSTETTGATDAPTTTEPMVDEPTALEQLVEAAQEDGVIYWGDNASPEVLDAVQDAFNARFGTDISVELVAGRASDLVVRMQQESQAGRYTMDGTHASVSLLYASLDEGYDMFDKDFDYVGVFEDEFPDIRDAWENVPEALRGYGLQSNYLARLVVYNTDTVAPEDVPDSWDDLLTPRFADGRIAIDPSGSSTRQNIVRWSIEETVDYSVELAGQDPLFVSGDELFNSLARGEVDVAIATGTRLGNLLADQPDAPVKIAPMPFIPVEPQMLFLVKDAPNINAARLFAGWYATEGLAVFRANGQMRGRIGETGFPVGDLIAEVTANNDTEIVLQNTPELLAKGDEVRTLIAEAYRSMGIEDN